MNLAEIVKRMIPKESVDRTYQCDKCHDTGFISWTDENGIEYAKECSCSVRSRTIRRLEESGLAEQVERYTFKRFKTDKPYQKDMARKASEYAKGQYKQGRWFFVGGQSGSGKTHICTAIAGQIIKQGHAAKYMLWREDSMNLKSMVNTEEYARAIKKYKNVYCLYIDDLFKGRVSEADINLAFELIDARYRKRYPTIISSEYTISGIAEIDEAVAGRITECGTCINIGKDKHKNIRLQSGRQSV